MQDNKISNNGTLIWIIVLFLFCFLNTGAAIALGTPAGTVINNTLTVNYKINNAPQQTLTRSTNFVVDRVINMVVTKNADVNTAPTSSNVALSFLITNTGNASVRFALSAVSKATNTWSMNNVRIYRDNNSSGIWDAGDTLYSDASTFGDLASDVSAVVLIVADTPAVVEMGQASLYDLVATAVDAGTLNVSIPTAGTETSGIDTVFLDATGSAVGDGERDGKHSAAGSFGVIATALSVNLSKTVVKITDQWGSNLAIPGATLRYKIAATTTGSGTANNVVISDPLSENTTYIANTLRLNDTILTDTADGDAGTVQIAEPNVVTVKLGSLTSSSPVQTITFDVKIK